MQRTARQERFASRVIILKRHVSEEVSAIMRIIPLLVCVISSGALLAEQKGRAPLAPSGWVAFSADIRIEIPNRPEAWGRHVQDEHGCVRQDMVHPDGSALVTITNYQTERYYRLHHASWTTQPMHIGTRPRQPYQRPAGRKAQPIEGFDTYVSEVNLRSPRGDYKTEVMVIPALNYFEPVRETPTGERRTAVNIRVGPQPHEQFLPPAGAAVTEEPGFGGYMSFDAVALQIGFAGQTPIAAVTTEETAYPVKTPSGLPLTIVTSVIDKERNIVRVRVLNNATGRSGNVRGDVLDEVQVALGATGQTTKIGETLSITVTRIAGISK